MRTLQLKFIKKISNIMLQIARFAKKSIKKQVANMQNRTPSKFYLEESFWKRELWKRSAWEGLQTNKRSNPKLVEYQTLDSSKIKS